MKTNLTKVVLIILISLIGILFAKEVYAENTIIDLSNLVNSKNTTTSENTSNNTTNNTSKNNTTTVNNTVLSTNKVNNTSTNTSANKNNTTGNLPNTGVGDFVPGVLMIIALSVSAVYAYRKAQYYKNV